MGNATGTTVPDKSAREAITSLVDSVSSLAKLIADEALAEEKIRAAQEALSAVKKKISESLVQSYINFGPNINMPEDLMSQEQYYERLLLALEEMKRELNQRIRPLELQIIEANREYVRETFDHKTRKLTRCLEKIDEKTLGCQEQLNEYGRIRSELESLNDQLRQLGSNPIELPSGPTGGDLAEIILTRLEHLKSLGKI